MKPKSKTTLPATSNEGERTIMRRLLPGMLGCSLLLAALLPSRAHEDTETHSRLSVGAILFLAQTFPEDVALFSLEARELIVEGSIREDDFPYYIHHFFNPKTGAALDVPTAETAPKRASDFWTSALQSYRSGNRSGAASDLGHVLHLLQDMTSPAHVHIDNHAQIALTRCGGDGDDFEVWGYCTDYNFNAILQYITSNNVHASMLLPALTTGLRRIFDDQPQHASPVAGDINTGYTFVRSLANAVYDFTSFHVVLEDTPSLGNDLGAGELKTMFPTLIEDVVGGWYIDNIGWSAGDCQNIQNQAWWMMNDSDCHNDSCGFLCKKVSGYVYIENTGGGGVGADIPDDVRPIQYNRPWFIRRYGSVRNTHNANTMLRIYGDVLYPAAVAYGAGLLQAFLDEAIMPRPITDKPSQVTSTNAQLNGLVHPRGETAFAWFEWGTNASYGTPTPWQNAGAGQSLVSLSARLEGLAPDTVYHCRIVSSNRFGVRHGTNQTFRTPVLFVAGDAPNAWKITDRSTGSFLNYSTNLSDTLQQAATTNGWRYSVRARFIDDFGGSKTISSMTFFYQASANRRFLVWWDRNSDGGLTAEIEGRPVRILRNELDGSFYHTHEIRYTNGTATYLFDGTVIDAWTGVSLALHPAGHVFWGSGSSEGMGQMNFHQLEFEIMGVGVVASYRAGTAGNPLVAPDPVTQGWTANPAVPQFPNAFTPISPDFEPYLCVVETLPASNVRPAEARLNGRADPRGHAAAGWFEWGSSLSYGNTTQPRALRGVFGWTNVSETLDGLSPDQTYHFRFVANNGFAMVFGADQTLVTGRPVVILTSEILPPDQYRLQFVGTPGTGHEVLRSTDLSTWAPIGQGIEVSAGLFEFLDTAIPAGGGFYRVRSTAP